MKVHNLITIALLTPNIFSIVYAKDITISGTFNGIRVSKKNANKLCKLACEKDGRRYKNYNTQVEGGTYNCRCDFTAAEESYLENRD